MPCDKRFKQKNKRVRETIMTKENYIHIYGCPNCFYEWKRIGTKVKSYEEKLCDYCEKHSPMNNIERIDRFLDIMEWTKTSALPEILREIWKVIKEIKNKVD